MRTKWLVVEAVVWGLLIGIAIVAFHSDSIASPETPRPVPYMTERVFKPCVPETISPVHAVVVDWITKHPGLVYVDSIATPRYQSREIVNQYDDFMEYRVVGYDITIIYRR
jgi:hypothetical protein